MSSIIWTRLACIAVAGALGALARWSLTAAITKWAPAPWGTLVVNVLGCLVFGFLLGVMHERVPLESPLRLLALTGFLGAFTTYSTFAFDTHMLFATNSAQFHRAAGLALLNIVLHIALGWIALIAGISTAKLIG